MNMRLYLLIVLIGTIMVSPADSDILQTGLEHNNYIKDAGSWNLHLAQPPGERYFLQHVEFPQQFTERQPPIVLVMLSGLDSDDKNERVHVTAEGITNYGFDIRYTTWSDTRLYGASVTWIAIPRSMALYVPDDSKPEMWQTYYYYGTLPTQQISRTPYVY